MARERLDHDRAMQAISQAAGLGVKVVVFTGGEATLAGSTLLEGLALAHEYGLRTRLVTNGHWARNRRSAQSWLDKWSNAGLSEINFSTGDQHSRFVPVERVVLGVEAAIIRKMPVSVMVELRNNAELTAHELLTKYGLRTTLQKYGVNEGIVSESPWKPLDGWSAGENATGTTATAENVSARGGCDSVLGTLTVTPSGQVQACCGIGAERIPEMTLGLFGEVDLREAASMAQTDMLKLLIRHKGPEYVLAQAAVRDRSIAWEGMYAHRCQACLRIFADPAVRTQVEEIVESNTVDVLVREVLARGGVDTKTST